SDVFSFQIAHAGADLVESRFEWEAFEVAETTLLRLREPFGQQVAFDLLYFTLDTLAGGVVDHRYQLEGEKVVLVLLAVFDLISGDVEAHGHLRLIGLALDEVGRGI